MGRRRGQEDRPETAVRQEGSRRRPEVACRLQQGARHHLREARQEGSEIHGEGPAVPVHEQGAVREEHEHAAWDRVEHADWVPERHSAAGGHETGDDHFAVGEVVVDMVHICFELYWFIMISTALLGISSPACISAPCSLVSILS